ncbi:hypothetical protein [Chromobacterium sp. IIBBL 290-4]|uniref:hypothetical protein n=1 Tax=Chromobacterium sp. IIBBL 290-4 TaxID=2953890 RepID=UPI0020B8797B|nr:hypothetical protein [Chromobacterium sp. IIBBL 290-4]UTH73203.1 hypothetical protein NKT35_16925 [Chromobacterium sp. IIBBL 290-4]
MNRATLLLLAAAGTAGATAWFWLPVRSDGAGAPIGTEARSGSERSGGAGGTMGKGGTPAGERGFSFAVGGDPSSLPQGQNPAAPQETAAEKARKLQLRKLGYQIDARYYRMRLSDLREQASRGDPQALTHLAERYLFQLDGHPREPDYEPGFRYREEAREALQQAYAQGNAHAAAMISESYLLEKKPEDAAAWNLVARRSGDDLSADWFLKTKDYQALTDQQKTAAAERADQLMQSLQQRKAK